MKSYCGLLCYHHCLRPALYCSPAGLPGAPLGASCPRASSQAVPLPDALFTQALPHIPAGLPPTLALWWSPHPLPGHPPASGPSGCTQRSPTDVAPRWVLRPSSLPPWHPSGSRALSWQRRPIPEWIGASAALPWAALGGVMMCVLLSVRELRHLHRRWGEAAPATGRPRELRLLLQKPLEKTSVTLISVFT